MGERQELVYRSLGPWPEFRTAQGAMLRVDFNLPLALLFHSGANSHSIRIQPNRIDGAFASNGLSETFY